MINKVRITILITALVIASSFFNQEVQSQVASRYYLIESFVDSVQIDKNEPFESLAKKIIKPEWDECEKARGIFYWIAKNIKYDHEGLETDYWKKYPSDYKIALDTYMLRRGVCSGYSYLFALMCNEVGLESRVIDGYSRIETYQAGLPVDESNHAWNIVKIKGKWEFVDVTWANNSGDGSNINDYIF